MSPPQWKKISRWIGLALTSGFVLIIIPSCLPEGNSLKAESADISPQFTDFQPVKIQQLAQQTTVRILTSAASGSGVIVGRQEQTYTVLTNWHVVAFSDEYTIIAPDGVHYPLAKAPTQLGNVDIAIVQFRSTANYEVAQTSTELVKGEQVFATGFPMYHKGTLDTTFDLGIQNFQFTKGEISLLPSKSLSLGYRLGYTNNIEVGMSGGPIFNRQGLLIGINGRGKYRDPDFGVYMFEDGTEPPPALLKQMVRSSWGIPVSIYLQFLSLHQSNES